MDLVLLLPLASLSVVSLSIWAMVHSKSLSRSVLFLASRKSVTCVFWFGKSSCTLVAMDFLLFTSSFLTALTISSCDSGCGLMAHLAHLSLFFDVSLLLLLLELDSFLSALSESPAGRMIWVS